MRVQPGDYSISEVSQPVSDELRAEVTAFWLGNGALPDGHEARRRADELVCIARNGRGEIVGVNTAYLAGLQSPDDRYFHYRMFLRPADRHLHLSCELVRQAVERLRARGAEDPTIAGIVLETENRKLMRSGGNRILTHLGWHKIGRNARGLDVWTIEFDS